MWSENQNDTNLKYVIITFRRPIEYFSPIVKDQIQVMSNVDYLEQNVFFRK